MADEALNDTKGRLVEIVDDGGDLQVIPCSAIAADGVWEDGYANASITTVFADAANTEAIGSTWARKDHANGVITSAVDDTNNLWRIILDADDTWTGVASSNDVVALVIAEDTATDATDRIIGKWVFVVTTDGNDVTANYDQTNGIWTAA
jgi:hypothetical protein